MKSIKELSKEFNISSRTIRYYEELFNLNSIKKSNVRYYDDDFYIEANEILNEVERKVWEYVNGISDKY